MLHTLKIQQQKANDYALTLSPPHAPSPAGGHLAVALAMLVEHCHGK
jgi:hypothetical protein